MHGQRPAEPPRESHRVAFEHEIELARLPAEQDVTNGAADHVDAVDAPQRRRDVR
jgi:hypothetical protein